MREKTEFEKALDRYYEVFGENYPLMTTDTHSTEYHLKRIEGCIKSKHKAKDTDYKKGVVY